MPLLALIVSALLAQAPAAPKAAEPVTWSGTVALGLISLTGNSRTLTLSTNAALERKSTDWIWRAKASGAYGRGQSPGGGPTQITALNGAFEVRGDRRFDDRLSGYLMTGVDTDHLKSIEWRPFGEVGLSFIWFDHKEGDFQQSTLRTDLGFRYGREYRFQYYPVQRSAREDPALAEVDVVAPRVGAFFRYALNKDVIFTEEVSALGNVSGTARLLFTSTSKVAARLTGKMSLGAGFAVNEDTEPPTGKVPVDTALTVGVEIAI